MYVLNSLRLFTAGLLSKSLATVRLKVFTTTLSHNGHHCYSGHCPTSWFSQTLELFTPSDVNFLLSWATFGTADMNQPTHRGAPISHAHRVRPYVMKLTDPVSRTLFPKKKLKTRDNAQTQWSSTL